MDNLSNKIPSEILGYIFSFREEKEIKDIASVSKEWNTIINKSLASLFQSYAKSETLKSYTELAKQRRFIPPADQDQGQYENLQRVKFVFHEIMTKARQMGYQEEPVNLENLSAAHLQDVVKWIQEQEAQNLNLFVSQIPEMNTFLDTIQDLPDLEKAKEIKTWMKANESNLKNITNLTITNCNLTALPEEIKYFTGLQSLNLSENRLTTLPSVIGSLTNLIEIDLSNNQLKTLPSAIGSLTNLRNLSLADNQLTTLPSEIGSLANLRELNLDHNRLTTLPSAIGSLTNLRELQLASNRLKKLPSKIGSLTNLEIISLINNQLETLPNEIGSLTKLRELYLFNNKITKLPNKIAQLTHQGNGVFKT